MGLELLLKGMEPWQLVIGLLSTGAGVGYFTRSVLSKLIDPKIEELQSENKTLTADVNACRVDLGACETERKTFRQRLTKYETVREALLAEEDDLWRLYPETPPNGYFERLSKSRVKIIMVGNHKGGVGKTTLTANLAAYLEKRLGKRVLVIDLDYQGSLTKTMLTAVSVKRSSSLVNGLLDGTATGAQVVSLAKTLQPVLPQTSIITAEYDFYRLENKLMLRWLMGEIDTDIRFHLGNVLLSNEVQQAYDVILLDTPPRLTTAAINAMAASHYVLVPTIPDGLSVEAVGRFMRHIKDLQGRLNPALAFAGAVINLSRVNTLGDGEKDAIAAVKSDLAGLGLPAHIFSQNIPRMVALSGAAGEDIAYTNDRTFREGIMNPLGDEIAQRIGFGVPA